MRSTLRARRSINWLCLQMGRKQSGYRNAKVDTGDLVILEADTYINKSLTDNG